MAPPVKNLYPSDKELLAIVVESGTYSAAAKRLGVSKTALSERMRERGLDKLYRKLKQRELTARKLPKTPDPTEALKQELAEARTALQAARSDDVREQRVIRVIRDAVEARSPVYRPAKRNAALKHRDEHAFVLLWSDAHAGEVVDPSAVGGMNSYDWSIMLARHQEIFQAVASYVEHRNAPINTLYVAALGDALSGNIHDELKETNELPLAEATVQFGLDAADWLEQFLELFSAVRFTGVFGNHARESVKRQAKRKYSNADRVCYQVMAQRLRRQNAITFDLPKSSRQPLSVFGKNLLLTHGDEVGPSAMVGVPWGGIIRHVSRVRNQYANMGMPIDHFLYGHFHEANAVSAKRIIVNGSIVGANEYGLEKFGESSPPEQILLTFNRKFGLVDVSFIQMKEGLNATV